MIATETPLISFSSDDLDRAYREWGCNCGPAALAACLGRTPDAVRPHLGDFERLGYMSPTMMGLAIESAGFRLAPARHDAGLPAHGLARVLWGGPWPPRAAGRYSHWIATKRIGPVTWVFDVNAGWEPARLWESATAPLIAESVKRADGSWSYSHRWEVRCAQS